MKISIFVTQLLHFNSKNLENKTKMLLQCCDSQQNKQNIQWEVMKQLTESHNRQV